MKKEDARNYGIKSRKEMDPAIKKKADEALFEKVLDYVKTSGTEHVLCFVGFRSEPATELLIERLLREGISVYCPLVTDENLIRFLQISSLYDLDEGYQGIREPEEDLPDFEFLYRRLPVALSTLVILPGSSFDLSGNRTGYGGGYYDRFLQAHPDLKTAAICYECQIVSQIETEEHDKKTDLLFTETSFYQFQK